MDGIKRIHKELNDINFKPELIISASRNGALAAGMLATRMNIDQVFILPRKLEVTDAGKWKGTKKKFTIEDYLVVKPDRLREKKILILFLFTRSGGTLDAIRDFLVPEGQHAPNNFKFAAIYREYQPLRDDDIISVYTKANIKKDILDRLPWLKDEYRFVTGNSTEKSHV